MSVLAILGSSNSQGNTKQFLQSVCERMDIEVIDLNDLDIGYFDYEQKNRNDDFLSVIRKMVAHEKIIFATPVYWYSMSAVMKTFVDRFSDLLISEKGLGRKLRGKTGYVLSTASSPECPACFEEVFRATFEYLGMKYGGLGFCSCEAGFDMMAQEKYVSAFVRLFT